MNYCIQNYELFVLCFIKSPYILAKFSRVIVGNLNKTFFTELSDGVHKITSLTIACFMFRIIGLVFF